MLTGEKVLLRQPQNSDVLPLLALRNDVEMQLQLMALPRANSVQKLNEWLDRNLNDAETVFFVIADKSDNQVIGFIQIKNINFINRVGELGIGLTKSAQGKGFAEDAMKMLEQYCKSVFNLRKIVLEVLEINERAIKFYIRFGYRQVGILTENHYQNDVFQNVVIMEKFIPQS